ncbi:MAG: type IV pilin protein, partial [Candidatus Competibacteraceae bacterium]
YQDSVRKSRRADAKAVMAEAAQFMERFYTENFCYSNRRTAAGCAGAAVALPAPLQASPQGRHSKVLQHHAGQPGGDDL